MKKYLFIVLTLAMMLMLFSAVAQAAAPNTACGNVYVNDDNYTGANTVTAFSCDTVTGLTNMGQTATGGNGQGGGFFGADRVKVLKLGPYLYASDAGTGDIGIFKIGAGGALTHLGNYVSGLTGDDSLVAGGKCVIGGYANFGVVNSYSVGTNGALTLVSSVSSGTVDGLAATKSGGSYYVAWATLAGYGYSTVNAACALGTPSFVGGPGGEAGVSFSADGSKIYFGVANGGSTTIEEGSFPGGGLTAYSYGSGGINSNTVIVNKAGTCAYAGDSFSPGVTAIDMVGGIPGATSTFIGDGSGNFYSGQIIFHSSGKAVFIMSTSGSSNQVDAYLTGSGCSGTLSFKGGYTTGVSGPYSMSLTANPQYGY